MKKTLALLTCLMPVILLGLFYVFRIGFQMRDANIAGMLMIMIGAFLSVLTPLILLLSRLFFKRRSRLGSSFACSFLSAVTFWVLAYLDIGDQLHRFIAA